MVKTFLVPIFQLCSFDSFQWCILKLQENVSLSWEQNDFQCIPKLLQSWFLSLPWLINAMLRGFSYKTILQPLSAPNKKNGTCSKAWIGRPRACAFFCMPLKGPWPPWLGISTLGQVFGKCMKKGTLIEQYPYRQTCVRSVVVLFYSSMGTLGRPGQARCNGRFFSSFRTHDQGNRHQRTFSSYARNSPNDWIV